MQIKKFIYGVLARSASALKRGYCYIITNYQKNMMPKCGKDVFLENYCDGNWCILRVSRSVFTDK